MFNNLANPDIIQYFIDITYKRIPNFYKTYMLFIIKGFNLKKLFYIIWHAYNLEMNKSKKRDKIFT
jgi:hypothetical protein